jgi:hypothetical protein
MTQHELIYEIILIQILQGYGLRVRSLADRKHYKNRKEPFLKRRLKELRGHEKDNG